MFKDLNTSFDVIHAITELDRPMAEFCAKGGKSNVENVYTEFFNFSSIFNRDISNFAFCLQTKKIHRNYWGMGSTTFLLFNWLIC